MPTSGPETRSRGGRVLPVLSQRAVGLTYGLTPRSWVHLVPFNAHVTRKETCRTSSSETRGRHPWVPQEPMAWSKPPGALDHWEGTSPLARQFEKQRCPVSRASWKQAVPRGRPGSLIPVGYASQPHTRLALSYMPLFLRPKGEGPGPQSGSDLGVSHLGTRRLLGTASALIPTGTARCLLGDQGLGLGEASSPCSHTARGRRVRPGGLRRTFGTEMRHLRLVRQWELSGWSSTLHGPSSSPKPLTHYNRVHKAQPQVGTLAGDPGDGGAGAWFPGQRMGSSGRSPQSSGLRKEAAPAGPPASPEPVATDRSGDRPRHGHITSANGMDTVAEARGRGPQNTRETEVPLRPPRRHRHTDGGDRSFRSSACPTLLEPPAPKDVASLRVPLKRRVWQAQQRHRHRPAATNCGRQQFGIKTVSSMEMAFTSAFPLLLSRPGAPSDPT